MRVSRWLTAVSLGALLAGSALAQTTRYGDPDFTPENNWRSGMPVVLTAGTQDVQYAFDGNPLEIPFTIAGTRATVYLAVYTSGANPQYGGDPFGVGGIGGAALRAAGIDTLVSPLPGSVLRCRIPHHRLGRHRLPRQCRGPGRLRLLPHHHRRCVQADLDRPGLLRVEQPGLRFPVRSRPWCGTPTGWAPATTTPPSNSASNGRPWALIYSQIPRRTRASSCRG